ncbi:type II toxin-antitoxin system HipA family toxin [Candidatus Obscuribacterales bacterium]|nr:type II toxin-antitoxin system HipA family toxin [Candidatus Obscuribacterales bacterium]MBX3151017.1 type II toxin-antitoxin system HipA family toxin [Candidatus Obscuribacterales bacterium]
MTSKESQEECFVYITLPRTTESVTAGRFRLTKDRRGNSIGRFVYGKSYLARTDAVEIDPIDLKLRDGGYQNARLSGMFSSLRDAAPDFWGRHLIERYAGKTGLSEIDYLLESPDDRAGALGFGLNQKPPAPMRKFNKTIQLERLLHLAEKLVREQNEETDQESVQVQELLLLGTSMGGARPKAVIEDDVGLWVAKFGRPDDRWNNPRVEHAMLELARSCGISSARSRIESVGGKDVILVQRFDREKTSKGYIRARMISGLTLLRAEESALQRDRWSYLLMAEELRRVVSEPKKDATELFRRMCFNALISNSDDHPRNHSFIAFDRGWRLSPAYDLTPSPSVSQHRNLALICGENGRLASVRNLLSQCSRFLLAEQEARSIVSAMTAQVQTTWYATLRTHGVSERDADTIKSAFVYKGFDGDS